MTSYRVTYTPRSDATVEAEVSALASVYAYLLKNHRSKKANKPAPELVGRDGAKIKEDSASENYTG